MALGVDIPMRFQYIQTGYEKVADGIANITKNSRNTENRLEGFADRLKEGGNAADLMTGGLQQLGKVLKLGALSTVAITVTNALFSNMKAHIQEATDKSKAFNDSLDDMQRGSEKTRESIEAMLNPENTKTSEVKAAIDLADQMAKKRKEVYEDPAAEAKEKMSWGYQVGLYALMEKIWSVKKITRDMDIERSKADEQGQRILATRIEYLQKEQKLAKQLLEIRHEEAKVEKENAKNKEHFRAQYLGDKENLDEYNRGEKMRKIDEAARRYKVSNTHQRGVKGQPFDAEVADANILQQGSAILATRKLSREDRNSLSGAMDSAADRQALREKMDVNRQELKGATGTRAQAINKELAEQELQLVEMIGKERDRQDDAAEERKEKLAELEQQKKELMDQPAEAGSGARGSVIASGQRAQGGGGGVFQSGGANPMLHSAQKTNQQLQQINANIEKIKNAPSVLS